MFNVEPMEYERGETGDVWTNFGVCKREKQILERWAGLKDSVEHVCTFGAAGDKLFVGLFL